MTEYARTEYNFNDRFTLNDTSTDEDRFVLLDTEAFLDVVAENVDETRSTDVGSIDYGVHLGKGVFKIPVTLFAFSEADMADLIQDFKEAFNPELLEADATYGESAGGGGYHPLKWTETVGDTERDFMIYLKSMEIPRVQSDSYAGLSRDSQLMLKAQDPRKYSQTQTTLSGSGTATNAGTFPTPVEITITATGASSTSLRIANSTRSESIYVTTALSAGQSLVINTRTRSCKLNGTERRDYLEANTEWMLLSSGANTIAVTNGTNVTVSTKWYSAWEL